MISKAKVRFIKSLQVKKYRLSEQCFLVQGAKPVRETLGSDYQVVTLCATESFLSTCKNASKAGEVIVVSEPELTSLGSMEGNDSALAVVQMKAPGKPASMANSFALILDEIRDPGNLGTIVRIADWFGIKTIVASKGTVDLYNPKVINASMGSFLRVNFYYEDLNLFLSATRMPIYGAFMQGESVHTEKFGKEGLLVIGNESKGISPEVEKHVRRRITIPSYGKAESLNASVATAIILDNIKRQL